MAQFLGSYLSAYQGRIRGVGYGSYAPLDQWNLLISGGFQTPPGAEPPPQER